MTGTPASGSPPTAGQPATAVTSSENGSKPVFWRTQDNFQSIQAGKPYKVVFRITNGYAGPALTVVATCESCSAPAEPVTMEGRRTEPVGNEAPGSYYPMNITLPAPGRWRLVVQAGSDAASILVEVPPS